MRKKQITNVHEGRGSVTFTYVYKKDVKKGFFMTDRGYQGFKKYTWNIDNNGYAYTMIEGKKVLLHQFIAGFEYTDHKNRNRLDNRRRNLREVTAQQNSFNRSFNKFNLPQGVWPQGDRWRVTITKNDMRHLIGYFDNLLDAVLARQEAELVYFGDMANNYNAFILWLRENHKELVK